MGNRPVRVPVGSWIVIGPPGSGTDTVLRPALEAAGMPANRAVSRDDLRVKFGNRCSHLGCRAVPVSCRHFEDQVDTLVAAHATTFLAAGQSWLYDATNTDETLLVEHVDRAHRAGLAAVAFRRTGPAGLLPEEQCQATNRASHRRLPAGEVTRIHAEYTALTAELLYGLGFDLVVDWDERTRFELCPESVDARGLDTCGVVVVGDLHGCARTFFDRFLPAVGTDADLSNPDVLVVSVGDVHDKGDPAGSVELIRWWLRALRTGRALMVDSNHSRKLVKYLAGHDVRISPAMAQTVAEIDAQPDAEQLRAQIIAQFGRLPSHLWFDDLVVVHAGITEQLLGDTSTRARSFMLYVRDAIRPWQWTGPQTLVHGHEPVPAPARRRAEPDPDRPGHTPGEVIDVDTGAYLGDGLSWYVHATGATRTVPTHPADLEPTRERVLVDPFAEIDDDVAAVA
jgi:predicted kinase